MKGGGKLTARRIPRPTAREPGPIVVPVTPGRRWRSRRSRVDKIAIRINAEAFGTGLAHAVLAAVTCTLRPDSRARIPEQSAPRREADRTIRADTAAAASARTFRSGSRTGFAVGFAAGAHGSDSRDRFLAEAVAVLSTLTLDAAWTLDHRESACFCGRNGAEEAGRYVATVAIPAAGAFHAASGARRASLEPTTAIAKAHGRILAVTLVATIAFDTRGCALLAGATTTAAAAAAVANGRVAANTLIAALALDTGGCALLLATTAAASAAKADRTVPAVAFEAALALDTRVRALLASRARSATSSGAAKVSFTVAHAIFTLAAGAASVGRSGCERTLIN